MSLAADANAGRVALVTGGGSGIGRATALAFARSGARVAVCGRRPEPLEETRALVEAAGGECLAVAADIREPDAVGTLVGAVLERFGTIDVLVEQRGRAVRRPGGADLRQRLARGRAGHGGRDLGSDAHGGRARHDPRP